MTTLNWGQLIQDSGGAFEPLPNGDYDAQVTRPEATTSSTGKPMFKVTFKIITGAFAGRTVPNQFVVSAENPNAMAMFFTHMKNLGLDKDFFNANPTNEQVAAALDGRVALITLGQRVWQGTNRNEVKAVKPARVAAPAAAGVPQVPQAAPPAPPQVYIPTVAAPAAPAPVAPAAPAPAAEPAAPPVPDVPF
jgi:Protein of unknown function (DUF669)